MLAFYVFLNFSLGYVSIILAHITFQIAYVFLVVSSRFQDFPDNIIEAAQDLGAGQKDIFIKIILPLTKEAVLGGGLITFTLFVDDFLITYFTAGADSSTLPIQIYSMVKRGVTPDVNALSTIILLSRYYYSIWEFHCRKERPQKGGVRIILQNNVCKSSEDEFYCSISWR